MQIAPFTNVGRPRVTPGKAVMLLGQSEDGPVCDPRAPRSPQEAISLFGDPQEGDLLPHYLLAHALFPNLDYILVRVNGEHARAGLNMHGLRLEINAWGAGRKYNDAALSSNDEELLVQWSDGRTMNYPFDPFPSIGHLCEAVHHDAERGRSPIVLTASDTLGSTDRIKDLPHTQIQGGRDRLYITMDELFLCLQQAYELLEGSYCDVVVPVGAFFDTPHIQQIGGGDVYGQASYGPDTNPMTLVDQATDRPVSFHEQLLEFVRDHRLSGSYVHGCMGLSPRLTEASTLDIPAQLIAEGTLINRNGFRFAGQDRIVDEGGNLSLCLQGVMRDGRWVSLAPVYAALWLTDVISMTNASALIQDEIAPQLSGSDLDRLADLGVVGFAYSNQRGWVVSHGVTAAEKDSDWSNADNIRGVQKTMRTMNTILDEEVGSTVPWGIRQHELQRRLNQVFEMLSDEHAIRDGRARVDPRSHHVTLEYSTSDTVRRITAQGSLGNGGA